MDDQVYSEMNNQKLQMFKKNQLTACESSKIFSNSTNLHENIQLNYKLPDCRSRSGRPTVPKAVLKHSWKLKKTC